MLKASCSIWIKEAIEQIWTKITKFTICSISVYFIPETRQFSADLVLSVHFPFYAFPVLWIIHPLRRADDTVTVLRINEAGIWRKTRSLFLTAWSRFFVVVTRCGWFNETWWSRPACHSLQNRQASWCSDSILYSVKRQAIPPPFTVPISQPVRWHSSEIEATLCHVYFSLDLFLQ